MRMSRNEAARAELEQEDKKARQKLELTQKLRQAYEDAKNGPNEDGKRNFRIGEARKSIQDAEASDLIQPGTWASMNQPNVPEPKRMTEEERLKSRAKNLEVQKREQQRRDKYPLDNELHRQLEADFMRAVTLVEPSTFRDGDVVSVQIGRLREAAAEHAAGAIERRQSKVALVNLRKEMLEYTEDYVRTLGNMIFDKMRGSLPSAEDIKAEMAAVMNAKGIR